MACRTRWRVSSVTRGLLLSTRETDIFETPARCATSLIATMALAPCSLHRASCSDSPCCYRYHGPFDLMLRHTRSSRQQQLRGENRGCVPCGTPLCVRRLSVNLGRAELTLLTRS